MSNDLPTCDRCSDRATRITHHDRPNTGRLTAYWCDKHYEEASTPTRPDWERFGLVDASTPDPYTVACPNCHSEIGIPCVDWAGGHPDTVTWDVCPERLNLAHAEADDVEDCVHCGRPVRWDEGRGDYVHLAGYASCYLHAADLFHRITLSVRLHDDDAENLPAILRLLADRLDAGWGWAETQPVSDVNGNTIGTLTIEEAP